MAAQPKKKISRVRGKTRRAHRRAVLPKLVACAKCKTLKLPHTICPECGHYGKVKVIKTKLDRKIDKTLNKPVSPGDNSGKTPVKNEKTPKKTDNGNRV
ncbi:50S ribosomal protein L32 [candidate division Kazan bacterium]|uniref:Large ribosomal subunit protein bL32 n=1 Tax=candidate division Kazan bacterium TaxID=2202143 RepID=A0A420ZCX3_UNCK3|nr:MAG: 50S ribosomal protein L32 [candidate division Kazan bacterium]